MANLQKHQYGFQIKELREYCNFLDEKIARYEKTGRSTERLKDNKARAQETIEQLKQAQKSNTTPLHGLR